MLPDLPLKRRGHDEERHLFASVVGAAERVTLSRSAFSATGREWPESPLLLRLRLARPELDEESAADVLAGSPIPVEAAATAVAVQGDRAALPDALRDAIRVRSRERSAGLDADEGSGASADIATGLLEIWREFDTPPGARAEVPLGPYFGWVATERRDAEPFITEVADLLRCPWQRFLRRELRILPPPDAGAALPSPDARLRGAVVHQILERVVEASYGAEASRDLGQRLRDAPIPVVWPSDAVLEEWTLAAAREVVRREGVAGEWLPALLARSLAPILARARALDEARGPRAYGAELDGGAELPGAGGRRVRFRVDRVEAADAAEGSSAAPVLVEYKSGRAFVDGVHPTTRTRRLVQTLARGEGVQVPAYLHTPGAAGARLVFLGPGLPDERRETEFDATDEAVLDAFRERTDAVFHALETGLRPPRLISDPGAASAGIGEACAFCEMQMACLQGDSAQLGRLRERVDAPSTALDAASLALLFGSPSNGSER